MQGSTEMVVRVEADGGTTTVTVEGDVDLVSSGELRDLLRSAVSDSRHVVVELDGLTFIDSSGLSAFVDAHRSARDAGGVIVLRNPPSLMRRLLQITRLDTLLVLDPADGTTADPA